MNRSGFTLIELLIVVAIIAILAGIAIVNLLQAQARAKTSRVMADMKTVGDAMEIYLLDNSNYPVANDGMYPGTGFYCWWTMVENGSRNYSGSLLTSPVAYLSRMPNDVFNKRPKRFIDGGPAGKTYSFWGNILTPGVVSERLDSWIEEMSVLGENFPDMFYWMLSSPGPDCEFWHDQKRLPQSFLYDPTNGTISLGDLSLCNVGWVSPK